MSSTREDLQAALERSGDKVLDPKDVDERGRQLVPGSYPIRIVERDASGRTVSERTHLLRRRRAEVPVSLMDPTRLVPVACGHGLKVRRDGFVVAESSRRTPDGGLEPPWGGRSWLRADFAGEWTADRGCQLDLTGEVLPIEAIMPADGSFVPRKEDLPEWAHI